MSRRSPLAALALLSLVATLLALPVMPAAARNGEQDDLPLYTACPSVRHPIRPDSRDVSPQKRGPGCHRLLGPLRDHAGYVFRHVLARHGE